MAKKTDEYTGPERAVAPARILIVEDNPLNRLLIHDVLELRGHEVFEAAGFPISKPELTALFRQPDHKNYRACGDQVLRNFLKGLTLRVRGP